MKRTNWLLVATFSIIAFVTGITATYVVLEFNDFTVIESNMEDDEFAEFLDVLTQLRRAHYFYDEETDLIRGAIDGMIAATGDAYAVFFTTAEFENAHTHLQGTFYGIGAEVTSINGDAVIVTPMQGSPAESYGVLPGDVIISVDGENVREYNLNEVISRIRGEYGTVVRLEMLRSGTDIVMIDVTRGRIVNETVTSDVFEDGGNTIGYIRVSNFGNTTFNDFRDAIADLEAQGIDGLIIDLRNNPGGYLSTVNAMISYLLPSGRNITSAVDRNGNAHDHVTTGSSSYRLDVEILTIINEGSASASELFAAAMLESGGFEVIGTTSFGKGTVQSPVSVGRDSMLQLTIQAFLSPEGNLIDGYGVVPTIYVEASEFRSFLQVHLEGEDELAYDMVHPGVQSAQLILDLLGYDVTRLDGYFDSSTEEAVRAFQQDNGLTPTGRIDGETATAVTMGWRDKVRDPHYDNQIQAAVEWFR
ncbi:MAG: S41 family peptidase [Turicibacter sp.]|nr:S41 family peptidase [Turicibacter sp.]